MKLFSTSKRQGVIGLDIGLSEIKAVQLGKNKRGQVTLVAYGNQPLPKNKKVDSIVHPDSYISALSSLLQSPRFGNFNGSSFAISLPARHTLIEKVNSPDDFTKLASQKLGIEPEQIHTKTFLAADNKSHIGLATMRAAFDPHLAALNAFKPVDYSEHESAAAARAFGLGGTGAVLVDFGAHQTVISSHSYHLQSVEIINIGVENLIEAFATNNNIQQSEAAEILYRFGLQTSGMQIKIRQSIKPFMTEIIKIISKFIDDQGFDVERVILYGGGACIPAFATYISRYLDKVVEVANPWAATDIYPLKPMPRRIAPQFSVAVGLALLGLS